MSAIAKGFAGRMLCLKACFRQTGPFEKLATVSPIIYAKLEAPRRARYAFVEANGDSEKCFYSGRLERHA